MMPQAKSKLPLNAVWNAPAAPGATSCTNCSMARPSSKFPGQLSAATTMSEGSSSVALSAATVDVGAPGSNGGGSQPKESESTPTRTPLPSISGWSRPSNPNRLPTPWLTTGFGRTCVLASTGSADRSAGSLPSRSRLSTGTRAENRMPPPWTFVAPIAASVRVSATGSLATPSMTTSPLRTFNAGLRLVNADRAWPEVRANCWYSSYKLISHGPSFASGCCLTVARSCSSGDRLRWPARFSVQ